MPVVRTFHQLSEKMKRKGSSSRNPSQEQASTGCSLEMMDLVLDSHSQPVDVSNDEEKKCHGVALLVKRLGADGNLKIKPYIVQNSFYAYPLNASREDKKAVMDKVNKLEMTYAANQYITEIKEFELPFEVEAICCVSGGYRNAAKAISAGDLEKPKKKKRRT
jgi:hypothetical protein